MNNPFVLCSDFSHFLTKFINDFDGVDARSVRCGTDDRTHEYIIIFFKGKNYYVTFEPVETHGNFNDMTAVKLGQDLEGVKIINDETNSFKKTIDKVYSDLKNKKIVTKYEPIEQYRNKYMKEININYEENLESFMQYMNKKNINGSEFLCTFMNMERIGYFGDINYSFVVRNFRNDDNQFIQYRERHIIVEKNKQLFYIVPNKHKLYSVDSDMLNYLFDKKDLKYEDEKYIIEGVGIKK